MQVVFIFLISISVVFGENCIFKYSVPNMNSNSCDFRGGVGSSIEEKVFQLSGGLEGVKIIGDANMALMKEVQKAVDNSKTQQNQATQQLNRLKLQIQNVKSLMAGLHISHDEEKDDLTENIELREKRAVDPDKDLKDALAEAEVKLMNISRLILENGRRQSVLQSSLESRLQKLGLRLQSTASKVAQLERDIQQQMNQVKPGVAHSGQYATADELSNLVNRSIQAIAITNAQQVIVATRYKDLDLRVDNQLVPIINRHEREIKQVPSSNQNLSNKVQATENSIKSLKSDLAKLENTVNTNVNTTLQQIKDEKTKFRRILNGVNNVTDQVNQNLKDDKNFSKTITNTDNELSSIAATVTQSLADLTAIHKNVTDLKNSPFLSYEEFQLAAQADLQKELQVLQNLKMKMAALNSTVTKLLNPTPTLHPRKRAMALPIMCKT